MNILIKNIDIVTMDNYYSVIKDGYIFIEDTMISYIGKENPLDNKADIEINGKNKVAIPGLVNSHTHIPMVLLRNYADDLPLQTWLFKKIFPIEDKFTADDIYWASMLAIAEMIRFGTTTFADMYFFMDNIAQAVLETGIRAHLSRGLQCFDINSDIKTDRRINENIDLYKTWNGKADGRIRVGFGPHSIYTCVPDYLKTVGEIAETFGADIHIHLSETKKEYDESINNYQNSPVAFLREQGIFKNRTIAAHCVHVDEKDIEILLQNNVNVVYNPGSNLKLGSGIPPIHIMLNKGLNVAIGTDGASSNNNLNLFEEIYLAAVVSKGVNEEPTLITAKEALKMATVNGGKALGFNDVGVLKPGMKADIVLIDTDKPHYYPRHNILSSLVYSAQGTDVDTVIVNGKILMSQGEFKVIDYEKVIYNIEKITKRLW